MPLSVPDFDLRFRLRALVALTMGPLHAQAVMPGPFNLPFSFLLCNVHHYILALSYCIFFIMYLLHFNTLSIWLHCTSDFELHCKDEANTFPFITVGYMAERFHFNHQWLCYLVLIILCGIILYFMISSVSIKHYYGHHSPSRHFLFDYWWYSGSFQHLLNWTMWEV